MATIDILAKNGQNVEIHDFKSCAVVGLGPALGPDPKPIVCSRRFCGAEPLKKWPFWAKMAILGQNGHFWALFWPKWPKMAILNFLQLFYLP